MKVAIGCDPNAAGLKEQLARYIVDLGHICVDYGSEDPIYANTAVAVARSIISGECERGVLVCGTGIGMSIAANKVKGVYAALVNDVYQAERAQLSNHANIITIGSLVTGVEVAKMMVKAYLEATFDPKSHSMPKVRRIQEYERAGG